MNNSLSEAIEILKRMPEKGVEKALEKIREIQSEIDKEDRTKVPGCPHCGLENVIKNGRGHGKQAYICKSCGKSFVETTKTAMENSHSGEAVWKQVICDTINGVSIDRTAESLDLHHETVFNMRHKILFCLEREEIANPTQLSGICEADETYILESYKGKKLPDGFWRKPRKHGAVAKNPGLSNEYICVCSGVERDGAAVAVAVNRGTAGKDDVNQVFGERVNSGTVILSDGAKAYGILNESGKCSVLNANNDEDSFFNINTVNNFHSVIKERNRAARGFATKYLNRYNILFSTAYRKTSAVVDAVYKKMTDMHNRYNTIAQTQSQNLLEI